MLILITQTDFYIALVVVVLLCILFYQTGKAHGRRMQIRNRTNESGL